MENCIMKVLTTTADDSDKIDDDVKRKMVRTQNQ